MRTYSYAREAIVAAMPQRPTCISLVLNIAMLAHEAGILLETSCVCRNRQYSIRVRGKKGHEYGFWLRLGQSHARRTQAP